MDWLNEPWFEIPAFVTLTGIALGAVRWTWGHIVKPGWGLMKAAVHLAEIHSTVDESLPILKELNDKFQPNGKSVFDVVTELADGQAALERHMAEMSGEVSQIASDVAAFIITRQPGGQRATD